MIAGHEQTAAADLLIGGAIRGRDTDGFVEFRIAQAGGQGMRRKFAPLTDYRDALEEVLALSPIGDVYVGCAPRVRESGKAEDVDRVWVLWADCDGDTAVERLANFGLAPHVIVKTGSANNVHAWWALKEPLAGAHAERANRRIAHHLGADMRSTDRARILRVPGSFNHKSGEPVPVRCEKFDAFPGYTARQLVGELVDPPHQLLERRAPRPTPLGREDVLGRISPQEYVPALTGRPLGRDGKVRCPFHGDGQERTPSLHVYPDPEKGWTCFGCGRGGTIIDLGALRYGIEPRGRGYHDLRRRLATELLRIRGSRRDPHATRTIG